MNDRDKDKEAFKEWADKVEMEWGIDGKKVTLFTRLDMEEAWQAACEYKQAELAHHIFKIERENSLCEEMRGEIEKLKQLLAKATTVIKRCEFGLQPEFYGGKDNGSLKDCRDFLKELELR